MALSEPPDSSDDEELTPVPLHEAVHRLVQEAAYSRVRHRALLAYLEERGLIEYDTYFKYFMEFAARDWGHLFARLMLPEGDFRQHFSEWIAEDAQRYTRPKPRKKKAPARKADSAKS